MSQEIAPIIEYYKNLGLDNITYLCEVDNKLKLERWQDVLGFESIYKISDLGRVKSLKFNRERILTQINTTGGYLDIGLHKNKFFKKERFKVHRLVAIAFIPNIENKPEVNHKKGFTKHNVVSQLEWVTSKENQLHAYRTGLRTSLKGNKVNSCKLKEKDVLEIRRIGDTISKAEIARRFGVTDVNIGSILRRTTWKHI